MPWKIVMIFFGVISIHLSIIFFRSQPVFASDKNDENRMKVIIDTDAGGDDAVALLLALAAKEVQIIAVTCIYGNTLIENVEKNVLKTLTIAGRSDIPVFSGARKPLLNDFVASDYFGNDGFGDFHFDQEVKSDIDKSDYAANSMINLVKKYPGEVNILTLGPLTNVALAASLDSNFTRLVKRFYVMGSVIKEPNNAKEISEIEFNFGLDPESDAIFLNSSTKFESLVAPWDAVVRSSISMEWRTGTLGTLSNKSIKFLNKVENKILNKSSEWQPADSIAVATMIWPDLVTSSTKGRMSAVIHGSLKGSVDFRESTDGVTNNVEIIRNFNVSAFKDKLMSHLSRI